MNATGKGGFGDHPENIKPSPGRPKDTITPLVKAIGTENDSAKARALAETLWAKAIDGDIQAAKLVWMKLDGMPGQSIQIDGGKDAAWLEFLRNVPKSERPSTENTEALLGDGAEAADIGGRSTFGEDIPQ